MAVFFGLNVPSTGHSQSEVHIQNSSSPIPNICHQTTIKTLTRFWTDTSQSTADARQRISVFLHSSVLLQLRPQRPCGLLQDVHLRFHISDVALRPTTETVSTIRDWGVLRVQELCESRGGRPGLPVLISLMFLWT